MLDSMKRLSKDFLWVGLDCPRFMEHIIADSNDSSNLEASRGTA